MIPPREVVYPSAMNVKDVLGLFEAPFTELVYRAASVHRENFHPAEVQLSTLLSVKTGGCPEDCAYCPQSRRYATGVQDEDVLSVETVL
ncbi:MAG TPA: biotin synthase BioB, partial [Burkholderiales bacterium]|nr:biotin synthase BioB [Burkholderiales bacterium]